VERGGAVPQFLAHNRALRAELLEWEARLRKRDLFAGERAVASFYEARLAADVRDRPSLLAWCRDPANGGMLQMTAADIASRDPAVLPAADYPTELPVAGQGVPLVYRFEPGAEADGVTLALPRALLGAARSAELDWLVPGWLREKILTLLRALPKEQRKQFVPVPDTADAVLAELEPRRGAQSLVPALCEALAKTRGARLTADAFDETALPPHLRMRVEVLDSNGTVLAAGRDLNALQRSLLGPAPSPASGARATWTRTGITHWDFGDLPDTVLVPQRPRDLRLYPALGDDDGRVDLKLVPPGAAAVERHRAGVRRLLLKSLPQQTALIKERALAERELVLAYHGIGSTQLLLDDLLCASAEDAFALDPPPRTGAAFAAALTGGRGQLVDAAERLRALLREILPLYRQLRREIDDPSRKAEPRVRDDLAAQLDGLMAPYFLADTPARWRKHLPRYLRAALARWEKRGQKRDAELAAQVRAAAEPLERWRAAQPPDWPWPPAVTDYRWLLEEFRVSLFAQPLGTAQPVSAKRLEQAWARAEK
jgi:ATP-dependent helicase HrpA